MTNGDGALLVTKGALHNVLEACSLAECPGSKVVPLSEVEAEIQDRFEELSKQGFGF
jgi:Mg2+-importing ATPase